MRRRKRKARQVVPKISKLKSTQEDYSEAEEPEKEIKQIVDDEDPKRAELLTRLNEAVSRWKDQKGIPLPKKEQNAFSKVFQKFSKKDKKQKKAYADAKNFLKKISNFNPKEVEKINLDDIKVKKKIEKIKRHPRSIDGEKLQIELKDQPKETKKQKKKEILQEIDLTKIKPRLDKHHHKEEIENAIKQEKLKAKTITMKKTLHITEQIMPEERKTIEEKKKKVKIDKEQVEKFKKILEKKADVVKAGLKEALISIKKQMHKAKGAFEYPEKTAKESQRERVPFLKIHEPIHKQIHKHKHTKKPEIHQHKRKIYKGKIDEDIEKIYKEIIEI